MAKLNQALRPRATAGLRTNGGAHPCVMLTSPMRLKGRGKKAIATVHLTSSRKNYDPTCIFKAGDDALITKDCWVYYAMARIKDAAELEEEIRKRNLTVRMISRAAYMRIIKGLLSNPETPPDVLDYFKEARRRGLAG